MRLTTKTLSDGTKQIGYRNEQGWVGVTNLYRNQNGWVSDTYSGWHRTIGEWKIRLTPIKT